MKNDVLVQGSSIYLPYLVFGERHLASFGADTSLQQYSKADPRTDSFLKNTCIGLDRIYT